MAFNFHVMKHLIPISGGKDSQATAIWYAQNVLSDDVPVELIFCDTGNEAPITYEFIHKILIPAFPAAMQNLIVLKNKHGETLLEQAARKGRFPSKTHRFCTAELKVEPMIDYILEQNQDVVIYDGRRRQESPERSTLPQRDDFFDEYAEATGKDRLYKKRAVLAWMKQYQAGVFRPVLHFSAKEIFEFISQAGHRRNPLYDAGFNRVGCFPCILCSLGEIARVADNNPSKIDEIRKVEQEAGTTFFGPDKIPVRFCANQIVNKKGKLVGTPTIDEVINYANNRRHDDGLFRGTCQNRYVVCE